MEFNLDHETRYSVGYLLIESAERRLKQGYTEVFLGSGEWELVDQPPVDSARARHMVAFYHPKRKMTPILEIGECLVAGEGNELWHKERSYTPERLNKHARDRKVLFEEPIRLEDFISKLRGVSLKGVLNISNGKVR